MKTINFFFLIISKSKKLKDFYSSLTEIYIIYFDLLFYSLDIKTKSKINIFFSQLKKLMFVVSIIIEIVQFISLALFLYKLFKFTTIDIFLSWLIYSKIKYYLSSLIKSHIINVITYIIDNNNTVEEVYNKVFYQILKDHYKNIITINVILLYFTYEYKSLFFMVIAGLILALTLLYFSTMLFIYINFINKNIKNKPIIYIFLLTISLILIVFSLLIIRSSLIYINEFLIVKINGTNMGPAGGGGGLPTGPNGPPGNQPSGGPPPSDKAFFDNLNVSNYKKKTYEQNREAQRRRDERDVLLLDENPEAYDAKVERRKFYNRAKRVMPMEEYERRKKLREKRDLTMRRNMLESCLDLNLEGSSAQDLEKKIREGNRIREGYQGFNTFQTEQNPPVSHFASQREHNPFVPDVNVPQREHNPFVPDVNVPQPHMPNQNIPHYPYESRFSNTLRDNEVVPHNFQSQTYYSMQNPQINSSYNNQNLYNNNPYTQNTSSNNNNNISYTQNTTRTGGYTYNNLYTQDNRRGNTITTSSNNPITYSTNNSVTKVNITDLLTTTKNSSNTEQNRINIRDMLNTPKQQTRRINISDMVNSTNQQSRRINVSDMLNSTNQQTRRINVSDMVNSPKEQPRRINISDMVNTPKQQTRRINISDMVNSPKADSNKIRMKDILNPKD